MSNTIAALAKVQAEVKDAFTDKNNAHLKSKYASFGSILDAVRPALQKHGLVLLFNTDLVNDGQFLEINAGVVLAAEAGAAPPAIVKATVFYPFNLAWTPQQVNAAYTYGKKATALALFGITSTEEVDADDDGETVSKVDDTPATEFEIEQVYKLLEQVRGDRDGSTLASSFGKKTIEEFTGVEAKRALQALEAAAKRAKKGAK